MPELAEIQSAFDAALRGGLLPRGLTARNPAETERRFNVYRNNVAVSLTEALGVRFPVIRRLVGEAFFKPMARLYAETDRPASPILSQWGKGFADFLSGFAPLSAYPYMADVARIEYQRGVAFHAEDQRAARPDLFADANPAELVLGLHPSIAVLRLSHPAVSIWAANQPGIEPSPIKGDAEIALVLRDREFNVPVRAISAGDATLIESLQAGKPLLEAAQMAQAVMSHHNPQPLLLALFAAGAITEPEAGKCVP